MDNVYVGAHKKRPEAQKISKTVSPIEWRETRQWQTIRKGKLSTPLFINKAVSTTSIEHFMAKLLWSQNFSGQVHSSHSNFIRRRRRECLQLSCGLVCVEIESSSSPGHARSNAYMTWWPPRKLAHTHARIHRCGGEDYKRAARASPLQCARSSIGVAALIS